MNYSTEVLNFINGQTSISNIARELIQNGATPEEMEKLELVLQDLFDDGIIDKAKIQSINSGLQRETKRYSTEVAKGTPNEGKTINIGCKVDKDENVTVAIVTNTRNRGANKPSDKKTNDKSTADSMSLNDHMEAIAALCRDLQPEQKKDIVKMLASHLDLKVNSFARK